MRITRLHVEAWRNLRNITIQVPTESPLVCLVGENGTGKSNVLELVTAVAQRVGISPGLALSRGNPFEEPHRIEATVQITQSPATLFDDGFWEECVGKGLTWNGSILLQSARDEGREASTKIFAEGCKPERASWLAEQIVHRLQARKGTHYLYLDADRAYPPVSLESHRYAEAITRDWESPDWMRNRAFQPTRTLYTEWIEFFLASETQHGARYIQEERRAQREGSARPAFNDHFEPFKTSLQAVLPHLRFEGVDTTLKTLNFDSAGVPLKFTQLSGGEREIAFLIGQIERFRLQEGLLLVDEPELHLNPDLIRTWIAYLRDTIRDGQLWIATHSLEAVEVAGRSSSIVLQRTPGTRLVETAHPLNDRPVFAVLSAALGSPAFAISKLRFVFVEGERSLNERERFHRICGNPTVNRFMEAGNCTEVIRKVGTVRQLAIESDQEIHVGGILDRDLRSPEQLAELSKVPGIVLLMCHEIENLFLHPATLDCLTARHSIVRKATDIVIEAADRFAGAWIHQWTYVRDEALPEPTTALKTLVWRSDWQTISADVSMFVTAAVAAQGATAEIEAQLSTGLHAAIRSYESERRSDEFWKVCMGKQVLGPVAKSLGFAGPEFLERAVMQLWNSDEVARPHEVSSLRDLVQAL